MNTLTLLDQRILTHVAQLYDYPGADFVPMVKETCALLQHEVTPEISEHLEAFSEAVAFYTSDRLEEIHTLTFSLTPVCVPYIGIHLLGENNFKRGEFLGGLTVTCAAHGIEFAPELPDHIAPMLLLAAHVDDTDLQELLEYCLLPGMEKMSAQADTTSTPYRHLVKATYEIVKCLKTRFPHA